MKNCDPFVSLPLTKIRRNVSSQRYMYAIQYNCFLCNTLQLYLLQYNTTVFVTIHNKCIWYNTIQLNLIQYNTIEHVTIQYNLSIQCKTIWYNTIKLYLMQYNCNCYNKIQMHFIQCNSVWCRPPSKTQKCTHKWVWASITEPLRHHWFESNNIIRAYTQPNIEYA